MGWRRKGSVLAVLVSSVAVWAGYAVRDAVAERHDHDRARAAAVSAAASQSSRFAESVRKELNAGSLSRDAFSTLAAGTGVGMISAASTGDGVEVDFAVSILYAGGGSPTSPDLLYTCYTEHVSRAADGQVSESLAGTPCATLPPAMARSAPPVVLKSP